MQQSQPSRGTSAPRGGGRGDLHPSRTPTAATSGVAPLAPTAPRPQVAFQIIQQCQEFLVQLAWQEVRESPTMTVSDQKNRLLEAYGRFVLLFLQKAIPATNSSFLTCPEALRNGDRTASAAMLHQSTSTGRASISKDSLYRKAKKGTKMLLKYMGDWVRICKDPNTRPVDFTPAEPQSGTDRDEVWTKIKSSEHRSQECLKIFNSRSRNRHLAENTPEAIREALMHVNFARRGFSLEEEMALRGKYEAERLDADEGAIYDQIIENVEAGQVVADSDDDDAPASQVLPPTQYNQRQLLLHEAILKRLIVKFKAVITLTSLPQKRLLNTLEVVMRIYVLSIAANGPISCEHKPAQAQLAELNNAGSTRLT